jgi:hypothetical protein
LFENDFDGWFPVLSLVKIFFELNEERKIITTDEQAKTLRLKKTKVRKQRIMATLFRSPLVTPSLSVSFLKNNPVPLFGLRTSSGPFF